MKKKLFAYFLIVLMAMISVMGINVEAKSAMTITKKTKITTGSKTNTKFHTNKGYAFCITPRRNGPDVGASLKYKKDMNDGGLLYLLEKTGTSNDEYLATQLAVWRYHSQYVPDYFANHSGLSVVKKSKALASEAAKNRNYTSKQPTLSMSATMANLTLTDDGKYYKSGVITINASNIKNNVKYQLVNAPSGAKVENNGTKYYIVIPVDSVNSKVSVTLKATATGTYNTVERYSTGNSEQQELIVLVKNEKTITKSVTLTVIPEERSCEVVNGKYYDANGKVTDATTYELACKMHSCEIIGNHYFDKEGRDTDQASYEASCMHKCVQYDGKYYDANGKETDSETFELTCKKHYCEKVANQYFDKDGELTTYENYLSQCEKHYCENVNGYYFGKDGLVVSQADYLKQCVHICEIYDNQYYGSQGQLVTADEYKAQCEAQVVPVPNTGVGPFDGLLSIMIGASLIGGLGGTMFQLQKKRG